MKKAVVHEKQYLLEQVGDTQIVQVYPDGFEKLTRNEKITAYYLYSAAVAGRDIAYDQHHRDALEIRTLVEGIVRPKRPKITKELDSKVHDNILYYMKKFWINNGMYNERTREKFVPDVSFEEFSAAASIALESGADLGLKNGETLEHKLERLNKAIFNKDHEPLLTNKTPAYGEDILLTSANNFYEGVSEKEAKDYMSAPESSRFSMNSKLVKKDGKLEELVYRIGDEGESSALDLYSTELKRIAANLEKAQNTAAEKQSSSLKCLIKYFKTGELDDFRKFNIAWLQDNPKVDFINGFIEVYMDALGQKAEYEGAVFFVDEKKTKLMKDIAENAQYFEKRMPWDDKYKQNKPNSPVANSINVIVGAGGLGPMSPIGINLPNEQDLREKYGSKSVLLTNIINAATGASGKLSVNEFALQEEKEDAIKYAAVHHEAEVAMHEVIGHGSGKVSPDLKGDPASILGDYYSALEEARAELVALHHMFDPILVELDVLPDVKAAVEAYRAYARNDLVQLRRIKTGNSYSDDHMKAFHLIVQYQIRKTGAVVIEKNDGKTYYTVKSIEKMREGIAELLAEVMRIKAEGDYTACKNLVDEYGTFFDPELRDEVVERCNKINLPSYTACVFPYLNAEYDDRKNISDVIVEFPKSFMEQQLRFSKMY